MPIKGTVRPLYFLLGPAQSVAIQRLLVPPNLKVYNISDLEALSELVAGLRPDSTLASKLRQLLGFQTVGNDGRQGRQMAGNCWPRPHIVRALCAGSNMRSFLSWEAQCDPRNFQTLPSRL